MTSMQAEGDELVKRGLGAYYTIQSQGVAFTTKDSTQAIIQKHKKSSLYRLLH